MNREYFILTLLSHYEIAGRGEFFIGTLRCQTDRDIKKIFYSQLCGYEALKEVHYIIFSYDLVLDKDKWVNFIYFPENKIKIQVINLPKLDQCDNEKLKHILGVIFAADPKKYLGVYSEADRMYARIQEVQKDPEVMQEAAMMSLIIEEILNHSSR